MERLAARFLPPFSAGRKFRQNKAVGDFYFKDKTIKSVGIIRAANKLFYINVFQDEVTNNEFIANFRGKKTQALTDEALKNFSN